MAFSYDKLWKLLIDKKMTKENFRILIKASPTTIAAMGKGDGISPKVLERICIAFDCQPGDIMEYVPTVDPQESVPLSQMAKKAKSLSEISQKAPTLQELSKEV